MHGRCLLSDEQPMPKAPDPVLRVGASAGLPDLRRRRGLDGRQSRPFNFCKPLTRSVASMPKGWLDSRPDLRPRSVFVYKSLLKCHLIPAFGNLSIAEISPSQVRTWHASLISEKPGTASSRLSLATSNIQLSRQRRTSGAITLSSGERWCGSSH